MDNLEEMDRFLEKFYLPRLIQEEIEIMNNAITSWRRNCQPTPEFLPGEFHGQRSLVGYSPWGHKKWDTTEWLTFTFQLQALNLKLWSKISPKNKGPGPDSLTEVYQTFREELMPMLLKLSKNCRGRNTSKLILQGRHHPDTKTRQRQHTKK